MYNEPDKITIKNAVDELCNLLVQQESIKEAKKDIIEAVRDKVEISAKDLNTFAKIKYEDNLEKARQDADELFDTYEDIFLKNGTQGVDSDSE